MENDFNDPILRSIIREVGMLEQQIRTLEDGIAKRKHELMGQSAAPVSDQPVRPGQYIGIRMTDALKNYLTERGGGPIEMDRIAVDLAVAGVDLGQAGRHKQNIKIGMSAGQNRGTFYYDKSTDSVSLVKGPGAPKPVRKAH